MKCSHKMVFVLFLLMATGSAAICQDNYRYSIDLTKVEDDKISVALLVPKLTGETVNFYFPRIVPGTYMNSNYGRFVHELMAFDKAGKSIPVKKTDDNTWEISKANKLYKITYKVEDSWDSELDKKPYTMAGTSFEAGKNFVLNTCGIFGYLEDKRNTAFDLQFTKPAGFYAATGLEPYNSSNTQDMFKAGNADELYDSPMMFSLPDTTSVRVAQTDVLIAVYSPKKLISSAYLAQGLSKLLLATKDYLGGKLPVKKYAFIYYFNGEQAPLASAGAWEHSYSSFYSMPELPVEQIGKTMIDISSHEFFHIVTPLTISSKEVKAFNFNKTVLSKHLWLYEGSTEYDSHHAQVWGGLITPDVFLETLAEKIKNSRSQYNDSLSFTEMSVEAAGTYASQYNNVYEKGALISACLDLLLLQRSDLQYSLKNLKHDLGVKYGRDKYFIDNELFNDIEKLTWPEIKDFLLTYVQGSKPIPYERYFALAGVDYVARETVSKFSLGHDDNLRINTEQEIEFESDVTVNPTGVALGYKKGDIIWKVGGKELSILSFREVLKDYLASLKEGDQMFVTIKRKDAAGKMQVLDLKTPAKKQARVAEHLLRWTTNPTEQQIKLKNKWLNVGCR
ncbi:MAG: peptidase M61 [Rhizobacter sp.]|nr:peptidase M61 [Ferruginibacter sp.]